MATIAEAALHCDLSERRFRELLDEGVIARATRGSYDLDEVRVQYIRHIREAASGRAGETNALASEKARHAKEQADNLAISLDDIIVWDDISGTGPTTSPMGIRQIDTLRPNAAGDNAAFQRSGAASNWQAVAEAVADGDTSYVYSGTVGNVDLYNFADLATTPSVITAVIVNNHVRAEGGGTINVRAKAKRGSSTANGDTIEIGGTAYRSIQQAFMTDPSTSAAWTVAGVNAAQIGLEVI